MRKKIRQVWAFILAVVMCVTVVPPVPAKAETQVTTLFNGGISSNREGTSGTAYYWKDDVVKLTAKAADGATVVWSSTDTEDNLLIGEDTISGSSSGGYTAHSSDITISPSALAGKYTIKAKATYADTYQEIIYNITVQENDYVVLQYGKDSNEKIFTSTAGFTSVILVNEKCTDVKLEQVEVEVTDIDDETRDVITENAVSILGIGIPQVNTSKYPGCKEYQFLISSPSEITSDINKVALRLKTTIGAETSTGLVAKYWILKSASKVSNFKVTSSNKADNDVNQYSHIANQTIYMDSDEVITIAGSVEDSVTDSPILAINNAENNFESVIFRQTPNIIEDKIDFIITLKGKANREVNNESIKITTLSGIANEYRVKVYNVDRWNTSNVKIDNVMEGNFSGNQYSKYELVLSNLDSKEEVEWSSSATNTATVTSTGTQKARLDAPGYGYSMITAQVKATPASSRASMKRVIRATIAKIIDPEQFEIDASSLADTHHKLARGATATISAKAYSGGELSLYPSDYLQWKSSEENVATIDKNGKITAQSPGVTTISVSDIKGREIPQNKQTVTVYAPVTQITLKQLAYETATPRTIGNLNYAIGQSYILYADTLPNIDGVEAIEWKSSNENIAKIESHPSNNKIRYVKFVGTGNVTITANGEFNTTIKDSVTFSVTPAVPATTIKVTGGETVIKEKVWLPKDGTTTLTAVQTGASGTTANDVLTWYCEPADQNVVKISQDVNGATADIKAIGTGEVKVYAKNAKGVTSSPITVRGVVYTTSVSVTSATGKKVVGYENTLKLKPALSLGSTELTDLKWTTDDSTKIDFVKDEYGNVIVGSDGSVEVKGVNYTNTNVRITATSNNPASPRSGYIDLKVVNSVDSNCTIDPIADVTYTGKAMMPNIVITNSAGEELILNTHYRVTYKDNTNAGVATVTITGVEAQGYVDVATATFKILPVVMNSENATMADYTSKIIYDGKEKNTISPSVKVNVDGTERTLYKGRDFEYVYANHINAGMMTITAKGIGNYSGSIFKTYKIEPKAVSYINASLEKTSYEYEAGAIVPKVTVKDGNTVLTQGKDYNISYENNTNVSSASDRPAVIITGIGNYADQKTLNFTITTRNVTTLDDAYLKTTDYIYNGKAKKPKVVLAFIRQNGTRVTLREKRDYELTYYNNVEKGIAKATITGKGNYNGTLTLEFGIAERVKVSRAAIRSVKNSKAKRTVVTIKKISGVAGYEVAYSLNKKFPKNETKVRTTKKTTYTIKNLKKGTRYYVRVRAYKVNSINRKVFGSWSSVKNVRVKR